MPRQPFIWKTFVSFLVLLSFAALALTGLVLYIAPAGRIANWSEWTFGALQKAQWQAIHTMLAAVFLAAGVFHLILNWPVLRAYLRMRLSSGARRQREWVAATVVAAGLVGISVAGLPPAAQVMEFGETVKTSWGTNGNEPPVPHAELLSVAKLAEVRRIPIDRLLENLGNAGFTATKETTLAQIAASRNIAPSVVYKAMIAETDPTAHAPTATGGGYGRKTVEELSAQLQVPPEAALARLREAGIAATPQSNVREIAISHGKLPTDLVAIITAAP